MFEVGDLVQYLPHYGEGDGAWLIKGLIGIVISVSGLSSSEFQIVEVVWVDGQRENMAGCVLKRLEIL